MSTCQPCDSTGVVAIIRVLPTGWSGDIMYQLGIGFINVPMPQTVESARKIILRAPPDSMGRRAREVATAMARSLAAAVSETRCPECHGASNV